jgi:hypothetical protein
MKHPSYKKASNQYANRANKKLSKESKQELADELKRFSERLKSLDKD